MKDYNYFKRKLTPSNENFARNCCYEFLECEINANITTIREHFFYKIVEAFREIDGMINHDKYYDDKSGDEYFKTKDFHVELECIRSDVILLCDSYMAILLEKLDSKLYANIIKGLYFRWKEYYMYFFTDNDEDGYGYTGYNPYFPLRFPRSDEYFDIGEGVNINEMLEPIYVDKTEYLEALKRMNDYSTNDGFLRFTSALSIIIELEDKMMDEHQVVKEHRKKFTSLGRIREKNENAKKYMIMKNREIH